MRQILRFFFDEDSGFAVRDRKHQDPTYRKQCSIQSSERQPDGWDDARTHTFFVKKAGHTRSARKTTSVESLVTDKVTE